jgi:hypothetical protein
MLITLGELEIDGLAFRDLAQRGPALQSAASRVSYQLIGGADHSYATHVPQLWQTFQDWLAQAGIVPALVA